ncbi:MAG: DUF4198 domain-containing protein [Acidobacteriota bacterium]|nr:DUF4198 domain-containing protein [Acidobacteriota bacterium]
MIGIQISDWANNWAGIAAGLSTAAILAHNFWLAAKSEGEGVQSLRLEMNTGHHFPISESAIRPERVAEFRMVSETGSAPISVYQAEGPALVATIFSPPSGILVAALTLHPHPITLEADKFVHYLEDEDAFEFTSLHFQSGITTAPQRERYSKFAKAVIQSNGQSHGRSQESAADLSMRAVGHRLEIVPEIEIASMQGGGRGGERSGVKLPVRVLFEGEPLAGVRVSSGSEHLNHGAYLAHARTDKNGQALLDLAVPGHWYVRTHYIRRHSDPQVAEWESFWASLTFRT